MIRLRGVLALLAATAALAGGPLEAPFPKDHRQMRQTVGYEAMAAFLKSAARPGLITVTEEGKSTQGRSVFLVHLGRGKGTFRALLYAQQHGNEVSGKDALLTLIRDVAARPSLLPEHLDLYLMPMVNPDGAEAGKRYNGVGADLNRDHLVLAQPETRALHRAALRIQPFIVTLASMIGVRGLAKWLSSNENIDIGFGRDVAAEFAEVFRAKVEAQVPMKRLGTMEEFASFCMPFIDGTSGFTTGQFVAYAGGWV